MTISFNSVPSNLRVPFVTAEFDSSRAAQGPALLAYRSLLIGQKTSEGTATPNSLYKVTSADDVRTLAGRGSILHRQALAYFSSDKQTEVWIGVLGDNAAAVASYGTLTPSGTATADGTLDLYIAGDHVQVAVAAGDTAATIAAAIEAAIGRHAEGTVTMAGAAAADTVTVGGTTFTGAAGAATPGAATFSVDTSDTARATSLATQINAHSAASLVVSAVATGAVVTIRAVVPGPLGNAVVLTSSNGTRLAVSGSGTLANATDTDLPVSAGLSGSTVTVTARNKGLVANSFDLRVNYQDGEALPAGVTLAIVAMAHGSANPVLDTLISALGDSWFMIWAHPYTDATSLTAIENELADRAGPMRMIDGLAFTGAAGSHSTLATLGTSRNAKYSSIVETDASPTSPMEVAANVAAEVAKSAAADPARPFQTLTLGWVKAPAEANRFTLQERNLLLFDGISTIKTAPGDVVQIERLITTYQTNTSGAADTAYLDCNTPLTLLYLRYSWRTRIQSRYPRHKLASDGTRFGAGQAVITPLIAKAECVLWFQSMELLGLTEDSKQFKTDLIVERNATDSNRLDFKLSPNLVNQFIVGAAQFQFLL